MLHDDVPSPAFDVGFGRGRSDGRRIAVLYAVGFFLIATVRVLHDAYTYAAQQPLSLQVVFRQSLNGESYSYLRCHFGNPIVALADGSTDELTRTQPDGESGVAAPGYLGSQMETSMEDDPFNHVDGSEEELSRGRGERESRQKSRRSESDPANGNAASGTSHALASSKHIL